MREISIKIKDEERNEIKITKSLTDKDIISDDLSIEESI